MKWWKFALLLIVVLGISFGLLSLMPGADSLVRKIMVISSFVINLILGIALSLVLLFGAAVLGGIVAGAGLPALDDALDDRIYFEGTHYFLAGVVWTIVGAVLTVGALYLFSYVPAMDWVFNKIHSAAYAGPGTWEVLPVFWPIWAMILGAIGFKIGYED